MERADRGELESVPLISCAKWFSGFASPVAGYLMTLLEQVYHLIIYTYLHFYSGYSTCLYPYWTTWCRSRQGREDCGVCWEPPTYLLLYPGATWSFTLPFCCGLLKTLNLQAYWRGKETWVTFYVLYLDIYLLNCAFRVLLGSSTHCCKPLTW